MGHAGHACHGLGAGGLTEWERRRHLDLALTVEGEVNAMSEVDRIYFVDCVATEEAKMSRSMATKICLLRG